MIPVYNTEKYLKDCIQSIINQSFTNFEIILVDDGSKDSSLEICREFADADDRIQVIHKENGGVSSARNIGIDAAKGKFITFIDSDDWLLDGALDFVEKSFIRTGSDVFVFSIKKVSKTISRTYFPLENWTGPLNEARFPLAIGGYFFRLDIIRENNIRFVENLAYSEDRIFILSLAPFCRNITTCAETFYIYRNNDSAATNSKNGERIMRNQFRASELLFQMADHPMYCKFRERLLTQANGTMRWGIHAVVKHNPTKQNYIKMKDLFTELFSKEFEHPYYSYYKILITRHLLVSWKALCAKSALVSSRLKALVF